LEWKVIIRGIKIEKGGVGGDLPWNEYPTRVGPQPVKLPLNPSAR